MNIARELLVDLGRVALNLFLPRSTLGQRYQYLVAPLDTKIDLKTNKVIAGGTPDL